MIQTVESISLADLMILPFIERVWSLKSIIFNSLNYPNIENWLNNIRSNEAITKFTPSLDMLR